MEHEDDLADFGDREADEDRFAELVSEWDQEVDPDILMSDDVDLEPGE